jgi:hypothetical protein
MRITSRIGAAGWLLIALSGCSADPIGSPRYFVGGGVVWVEGGVRFTDNDGQPWSVYRIPVPR